MDFETKNDPLAWEVACLDAGDVVHSSTEEKLPLSLHRIVPVVGVMLQKIQKKSRRIWSKVWETLYMNLTPPFLQFKSAPDPGGTVSENDPKENRNKEP